MKETFIWNDWMKKKETKLPLHKRIHHHLRKHFHKHIHKVLHFSNYLHHYFLHIGELATIGIVTLSSGSILFASLTGLNADLYRNNSSEVAQALVSAIENPGQSLKQGNIISVRTMDMDVENTFTKGYCTYGAARISPEFFPYIDSLTQQRTRGGNAVDRCKNAADTGYKIGTTPVQGALIIYDAGGKFGPYGHVGKVMHYDSSLKKIIVRDMARVAKGMMSDRRDDLTTAQVKCYIYNNKATTVTQTDTGSSSVVAQNNTINATTTGSTTTTVPGTTTTPDTSDHGAATTDSGTSSSSTTTIPTDTTETQVSDTETSSTIGQTIITKEVSLTFDNLSDLAEHFLTQNNLTIALQTKSPLQLGDTATLTFNIKDKDNTPYSGLLPFAFTILSTNESLQPNISSIQLINNGMMDIDIAAEKIGTASIVIMMDGTKIGEFSLEVK